MTTDIKVMSFNIRFDNPNEEPEDRWELRKGACIDIITKYKPHLLGLQEPHQNQVDEIDAALEGYRWFGKGRYLTFFGINEEHNELNPILYDSEVLTLEASGTFWYSDTPEVPNSKWGCSAFPRIATWGRFEVKDTGKRLCFVNTHFDHESEDARTKAAELLLEMVPYVSQGLPTVVVGDLNAGESSPAHTKLCNHLVDCGSGVCEILPGMLGDVGTFVGFDKTIDSKIDFIFANKGLRPAGYGTVPDERPNGRCCSDHRPIMATLEFDPAYAIPDPPPGPPACLGSALAGTAGALGEKTSEVSAKAEEVGRALGAKAAAASRTLGAKAEVASRALGEKAREAKRELLPKAEQVARDAAGKAELLAKDAAAQAEERARAAKAEAERLVTAAAEQAVSALGNLFKSL